MTAAFSHDFDELDTERSVADSLDSTGHGGASVNDAGTAASWLDEFTDDAAIDDSTSLAQWEGDAGTLNPAQRKTLVMLLKSRFITAAKSPAEWRVLVESESLLRSRLNDLYLDLELDRAHGVAYKRQAVSDAGDKLPTLLYDTAWGREETILMIYLRTRLRSDRADGAQDVIVDRDEMLERVAQFRPPHATDVSGDARKSERAIEALKRAGILLATSDEQRLKVSPVIEVLMPLPKLQQLLEWFHANNGLDADLIPNPTAAGEVPLAGSGRHRAANDVDDVEWAGTEGDQEVDQ